MLVYIFRHAHKSSSPWDNPPLSSNGFEQAVGLVEDIDSERLPPPTMLLCSPKLRAVQSFQTLSQAHGLELKIHSALDERQSHESANNFKQRVSDFLNELNRADWQKEAIFICTHLDWIEDALILIPSSEDLLGLNHWSPSGYAGFEVQDGLWKLKTSQIRR